ncbi:hypothetical protein RWE15_16270 [Virgibacillus halophilus]|uniref:Uncharacterized protein n=2 Tax=Tigheibacillus halophilus TaxID=361280 RepID=A0ABU5C8R2_9BACI|nr:hypothetical protein [Virgibacillus halophilus]
MYRTNNIALIEIIFNARTPDHTPYYLLKDDGEDPKTALLEDILRQGQQAKEFCAFNPQMISTLIQGAISESMLNFQNEISIEEYSEELTKSILKIVK